MKILRTIDDRMTVLEGGILIFLLTVMMLLAFFQVVLRSAFSSGIVWADILLRHIVLWLGFLGGALATSKQRHIHIDAFAHYLSPRVRSAFGVFTNLFGAMVCILLTMASVRFIEGEIEANSLVYEGIPSWYAQIIIPVGFGLHVAHFLLRSMLNTGEALRKEATP